MLHAFETRRILIMALAAVIMVIPAVGHAQDCEIPLFVKQSLAGANVMILADNSGSMNAAVYHLEYDSKVTWSGYFSSGSTYYISKDGYREPNDFNSYWPSSPSIYLINSDNGEDGRYTGNYLNWMYFHATDIQRMGVPAVSRIQVLKAVLCEVIDRSARLKFGLTVFQNNDGGNIIGKCGVNPVSLKATINGITANTWTPLGESMETITDYFSYDGPDAAIQVPCQYNFCLVVTDGLPTMDTDVSPKYWDADGDGNDPGSCTSIGAPYSDSYNCSDHMDDLAYYMANEDLRPDMEDDQIVFSYVVGFHENGKLLQQTAENGDGLFFHAENAVELVMSIEYAIQDILRRISAGSAVAVVSTERGVDDRLYRGKFMPIDWDGFLECFAMPYEDGDHALWEAGNILSNRTPSSREIFTAVDDKVLEFNEGNAALLWPYMNVLDEGEGAALLRWSVGNDVMGFRDRKGWVLGDIVHSTPVVVGPPSKFTGEESYQNFHTAWETRRKMVYVGANDGMMHAFDAESGKEAWAFVPEFALPDFASMADSGYCHTYTCDQTVTVEDLKVDGSWTTVLASGGREGGSDIFLLDITNPAAPDFMWQATVPNDKYYVSEVQLMSIAGTAVAVVGSGLDEDTDDAWLYVYRISDGYLLGSVGLSSSKTRNKATRPAYVDYNLDGEVDLIYIADLNGSIWRFDTQESANPGAWDKSELFAGTQEITADPVAAFGPNGDVLVAFGTGAYLTEDDMMTLDPHSFLCVFDKHDGTTVTKKSMTDQTDSITELKDDRGWFVDLWNKEGERVTKEAVVVAETVIFTSFAPTMDACAAGGESWIYQMAYDTGGLPPESEEGADEADRSSSLGEGVASHPVVDLAAGTVVVQSSDASIDVEPIAAIIQRLTVRSWQESYDHVQDVAPAETIQ